MGWAGNPPCDAAIAKRSRGFHCGLFPAAIGRESQAFQQDLTMSDAPVSAALDRTERTGSPGLVLLLAVVLVGAAASFSFLPQEQAGRLTIGLLAVLAIAGVIGLFAFAVGFLQFSGQAARNDITKLIADSGADILVGRRLLAQRIEVGSGRQRVLCDSGGGEGEKGGKG